MLEFTLFTFGLICVQALPALMWHDGEGEHLFMDEAFLVPMTLLMPCLAVGTSFGVATLAVHLWKRKAWNKTLFNTAQVALSATVATWASAAIGGGITGGIVAGVLYAALTLLAVATLLSLIQKRDWTDIVLADVPFRSVMVSSSLVLGAAMAVGVTNNPAIFPVASMACIGAQLWYRESREAAPALATEAA